MIKNKKVFVVVLVIFMIPALGLGFGWFFTAKKSNDVKYKTLTVDANFEGDVSDNNENIGLLPGDKKDKKISIKPSGNAESFIRVKVNKNWCDNIDKLNSAPADNIEITYSDNVEENNDLENIESNKWYKDTDSDTGEEYLYYLGKVNDKTDKIDLIDGIEYTVNKPIPIENKYDYQNKDLNISVDMEIIQAKNNAFESKWNIKNEKLKNEFSKLSQSIKS